MQKVMLQHDVRCLDNETKDGILEYTWYGWEKVLVITDGSKIVAVKNATFFSFKKLGIEYKFIVE